MLITTDPKCSIAGNWLPWAWCNLRRNPFGELTREDRAEVAVVEVEAISRLVQQSYSAVQFIGDCGRGKTTRMLVLARSLSDAAYVYLPEAEPCPAIPEARPLLIDEAQRLPRVVRRRVFASGLPLILATHRCLGRQLRRAGYNVHTLRIGDQNDAPLICEAMNRRIEASRLGEGPVPVLSMGDAERLVTRFGSDIRAVEGYLYDQVQTQVCSHGQMRFVD